MNHTTNYSLPQWEDTDAVKREDMNAAMSAIDAAMAGGARIASGTYVGTGSIGSARANSLTFGFEPKLLILQTAPVATLEPRSVEPDQITLIIIRGVSEYYSTMLSATVYFTWNGNTVSWYSPSSARAQFNTNWKTFAYLAIG